MSHDDQLFLERTVLHVAYEPVRRACVSNAENTMYVLPASAL